MNFLVGVADKVPFKLSRPFHALRKDFVFPSPSTVEFVQLPFVRKIVHNSCSACQSIFLFNVIPRLFGNIHHINWKHDELYDNKEQNDHDSKGRVNKNAGQEE